MRSSCAVRVVLTASVRARLKKGADGHTTPYRDRQRAAVVLSRPGAGRTPGSPGASPWPWTPPASGAAGSPSTAWPG
jgi:hypothetical protein